MRPESKPVTVPPRPDLPSGEVRAVVGLAEAAVGELSVLVRLERVVLSVVVRPASGAVAVGLSNVLVSWLATEPIGLEARAPFRVAAPELSGVVKAPSGPAGLVSALTGLGTPAGVESESESGWVPVRMPALIAAD